MRGFKIVSIVALLLWLISLILTTIIPPDKGLGEDAEFLHHLTEMEGVSGHKRIFTYGSSGLLLGISAESLELITGRSARNLSTSGRGGQIETAITLMNPHIQKGDIVIIGDRSYRESHKTPDSFRNNFGRIRTINPFIPNLREYFPQISSPRTPYGDLVNYPPTNFISAEYDMNPAYTSENIEHMKMHIRLVKQSGGCPVLVLVPLLIKKKERVFFENATRQLFSLADSAGLTAYLLHADSLETDRSLFLDQNHLSKKGRTKWTTSIARELLERHLCDLNPASN